MTTNIGAAFQGMAALGSGLVLAFTQSWQIALAALAPSLLIVICSILKANQLRNDIAGADASEGIGLVQETVTNIRTVRALNIEDVLIEKLEKSLDKMSPSWKNGKIFLLT